MGHLLISCGRCHDELRSTTFYEPPTTLRTARSMKDLPAGEMNEVTWVEDLGKLALRATRAAGCRA